MIENNKLQYEKDFNELQLLTNQITTLQSEIQTINKRLISTDETYKQFKSTISEQKGQLEGYKKCMEALDEENAQIENRNSAITVENIKLQKVIDDYQSQYQTNWIELQSDYEVNIKNNNQQSEKLIEKLTSEIEEQSKKLDEKQTEYVNDIIELQKSTNQKKEILESLEAEKGKMELELAQRIFQDKNSL